MVPPAVRLRVRVCVVVVLILALRHVDILLNPQLTWEDGRIFLTEALAKPWYATWFSPFIGYFIVLPKIVADAFTPLTMLHAPLVFNIFSLGVMAFALTLPLASSFSHIAPLSVRMLWVLACALLPWHTETFGNITNVHWYVYYALTLFSIADVSHSSLMAVRWALPPLVWLGIFSTPNAMAIVPVLAVRLWWDRSSRSYQFYLHLAALAAVVLMMGAAARFGGGQPPGGVDLIGLTLLIVKGIGYKVVIETAAGGLGARVLEHAALYVAGTVVFVGMTAMLVRASAGQGNNRPHPAIIVAVVYYVLMSIVLCGLLRPQYIDHFITQGNYWGADRYFLVPSFYFLLLSLLAVRSVDIWQWLPRRAPMIAAMLYGAILVMNFRYPAIPDYGWRRQVLAYYQRLLDDSSQTPQGTFSIVTFPGEPWSLQAPLFRPSETERERLRELTARLAQ